MGSSASKQKLDNAIKSNDVTQLITIIRGNDNPKALLSELTKGKTALMEDELSPEMTDTLISEVKRAGGKPMLKDQLGRKDLEGWTCLLKACFFKPSAARIETIVMNILDCGGPEFLAEQLQHKTKQGRNCFLLLCHFPPSDQVVRQFVGVVVQAGIDLKDFFAKHDNDGFHCLMHLCASTSNTHHLLKFLIGNILSAGGPDFLKQVLLVQSNISTDSRSCFQIACENGNSEDSVANVKFLARILADFACLGKECERVLTIKRPAARQRLVDDMVKLARKAVEENTESKWQAEL